MDILSVDIASGETVNLEVYLVETGNNLRHGKWE